MRTIGNEIHLQRGEIWSLDFAVTNQKGHPYLILKNWLNPYLVITVTAARYEQPGDMRESYWLDLNMKYVEQADGSMQLEALKRFTSAEVLWLPNGFYANDIILNYGDKLVLNKNSEFNITNFLFFTDPNNDGNYVYKYVKDYSVDGMGLVNEDSVTWIDYDFRIIKQFNTKSWMEQGYLYDIKILAGESVQERIKSILSTQGISTDPLDTWSNTDWEEYISLIQNTEQREEIQTLYDEGVPLMPSYDVKGILLEPTPIYVSANIQGGVR